MSLSSRIYLFLLLAAPTFAMGQSTTQQDLGIVTAPQIAGGLGWVLHDSEIEFQAAAAAGATHARIADCTWQMVEGQSAPPNNVSTGYSLPPGCVSALNFAKKYGLKPTVLAAFGAPYHQILTLTVNSTVPAGASGIPVTYSSGVGGKTLASVVYPYDYLSPGDGTRLTVRHSYAGTLIDSLADNGNGSATITLAAGLENPIPSGTTLYVNEILYPSPITASPTDPSVLAYTKYAQYLAQQVKAYVTTGEVELWNEPPWFDECWDNRHNCYDHDPQIPGELPPGGVPNFGFVAALQVTAPIPGVPYIWSGSNKTASDGVLAPNMLKFSGTTFIQPQATVTIESLHPYGNNPEDALWNEPCLIANPKNPPHCNTIPGGGANMVFGESWTLMARQTNPNNGIHHVITETGTSTVTADLPHIARFTMRQYLGFMAADVDFIEFYRMYYLPNAGKTIFSFITPINHDTDFTPLPSYTAMAGLMSDIAPMKFAPVADYSPSTMPQVTSYSGIYSLNHLSIVGARAGDNANSIMYTLWQRSDWKTTGEATQCQLPFYLTPCWGTVPQPPDAPTTVTIPAGTKIAQVVNLDNRLPVSYSQSGSSLTLGVSDDPIEILFIPSGDNAPAAVTPKLILTSVPDQIQGSSVSVHASSISKGAVTYSIQSGPATISGATITSTDVGTVVVQASQAASGNYTAATTTTSFAVTASKPILTMSSVQDRTYGDPVIAQARSNSPAPISYSIVSGPATISGTAVTLTGAGTVVLGASQPKSGYFTAASATTSFQVAQRKPFLVFAAFPYQTYGTPLTVSATSASSGPVTYSVVSGPATISGSTVTFTNNGQVTLQASQAADGGYSAATATASFHVGVETPTLTFTPISSTPYNTTITVSASSQSAAPVTYFIVSGPARIIGSSVTTQSTAGTVVVKASQSALGGFSSTSTTTSFQVAQTVTPTLAFAAVASHYAGDTFNVSASSASTGTINYSLVSGPATLSGSTVSTNAAGSVVVKATQAASGIYNSASATVTINVAPLPALTFAPVDQKTSGDKFTLSATSPSPGAITYTVQSGPAIILSGSTCEVTGAGTVVVQANQAASGIYKAMRTQTSFTATGARPASLTFDWIHGKAFGDVFQVAATSASSGKIAYSVVSGEATISGSTVTITGTTGLVTLQASQIASGSFPAATTTVTFPIVQLPPALSFAAIAPPSTGDIFTATVVSNSTGKIKYRVVSGPAKSSGSTITVTGPGTVVLRADQDPGGRYGAGHVFTTVQVQ